MKITNSHLIKNREKELLEMISGDLDRDSIRNLLAAKYHLDLDGDRLTCRGGDLVVHDNQVAYKIEYDAVVNLSLLFSRQGECLEIVPSAGGGASTDKAADVPEDGAYAATSTREEADEVVPESGAYAYASAGKETDDVVPEDGAYAAASTGQEADDVVSESGTYAAISGETAAAKPDMPEEQNGPASDAGGDSPSARMASTIADMISEINKT